MLKESLIETKSTQDPNYAHKILGKITAKGYLQPLSKYIFRFYGNYVTTKIWKKKKFYINFDVVPMTTNID